MRMALGGRAKLILVGLGLFGLVFGWQGISYWWKYAYSRGTRTGVIRKISVKGSPVCKYLSGELALQGAVAGQAAEIFQFSVDNKSDDNPIVKELHDAERNGTRVTLDYRQDRPIWWRCNPNEYFITKVEK
jgi:hypothetical protein